MISLYTGTGGSSKSYHVARDIYRTLTFKRNVIATFPVNLDFIRGAVRNRKGEIKRYRRKIGDFVHRPYQYAYGRISCCICGNKPQKRHRGSNLACNRRMSDNV